jgi:hypothetical protein
MKLVQCARMYRNDIPVSREVRSKCGEEKVFQTHGEAVNFNLQIRR